MRRLLLALLTFLAAAAPAAAQDEPETVVARHGEIELVAGDDGDDRDSFCVGLRADAQTVAVTCGPPPLGRADAQLIAYTFGSRSFAGGAVPAEGTASVELEYVRGDRLRSDVTPGGPGAGRHAGKLAFFLVETTGVVGPRVEDEEEPPVLMRRFDAAGTLIGAASGGHEAPRTQPPRTLLRHRSLRVRAIATRDFAPSVLRLDRTQVNVCLEIRRPGETGGGICSWAGPLQPGLSVMPQRGCGRVGTLVHGFAGPAAVAVELTLGSGRRVRRATYDVSGLGTPARAVAIVAPRGEAVRSARALDAQGRTLERERVAGAPSVPRCSDDLTSGVYLFGFHPGPVTSSGPEQLVAGAAPGPRLLARDEGEYLCFGIDRVSGHAATCAIPAGEVDVAPPVTRATAASTAAAGLVPPGAAAVRVVFGRGKPVTAAISEGAEYAGAYRGHVRFYLATATGRRRVTEVQTLDERGELISVTPGPDAGTGTPRVIARGRGYRITGARFAFRYKAPGERAHSQRGTCFSIAARGERASRDDCMPLFGPFRIGRVVCSPRRGVIVGKGRAARLELAGGGTIASRAIVLPRRLGGGRLWLLEIPAGARVTRLRLGGKWQPYSVPPPRRQCGYALDPTF